jgi:hypothetical protein
MLPRLASRSGVSLPSDQGRKSFAGWGMAVLKSLGWVSNSNPFLNQTIQRSRAWLFAKTYTPFLTLPYF